MTEQIKVLSVPELSKQSGMSQYAIRQLCKTGKLPYLEFSRNHWLIKVSDFEQLFERRGDSKND